MNGKILRKYIFVSMCVAVAIDSQELSQNPLFGVYSWKFQGIFSPNTSPFPFYLYENRGTLHLNMNVQNGGGGLSWRGKGGEMGFSQIFSTDRLSTKSHDVFPRILYESIIDQ